MINKKFLLTILTTSSLSLFAADSGTGDGHSGGHGMAPRAAFAAVAQACADATMSRIVEAGKKYSEDDVPLKIDPTGVKIVGVTRERALEIAREASNNFKVVKIEAVPGSKFGYDVRLTPSPSPRHRSSSARSSAFSPTR